MRQGIRERRARSPGLCTARGRTVPWQRVIGSGGKILCTGELGFEQRLRLQGEGVEFTGLRVRIEQHRFHFFGNPKGGKRKKKSGREAKQKNA